MYSHARIPVARATKSLKDLPILDSHHERTVLRNATEARQQFFVLLSEVVADPSEVVLIEHKDLPGRGMLVSEAYREYVRHLERLVKTLAARTAGNRWGMGEALVWGSSEIGGVRTLSRPAIRSAGAIAGNRSALPRML